MKFLSLIILVLVTLSCTKSVTTPDTSSTSSSVDTTQVFINQWSGRYAGTTRLIATGLGGYKDTLVADTVTISVLNKTTWKLERRRWDHAAYHAGSSHWWVKRSSTIQVRKIPDLKAGTTSYNYQEDQRDLDLKLLSTDSISYHDELDPAYMHNYSSETEFVGKKLP
ncbi:hypothetical protein KFE98_11830 [bacterium SCSIO 12741]|nr:hypothetical protein KFE98_11830 [bacterium SCSIO 12741]